LLDGESGTVGTDWQGNFYQSGDVTWSSKAKFDQLVGRTQRVDANSKSGERFDAYREFSVDASKLQDVIQRISPSQADALIDRWGNDPATADVAKLLEKSQLGQPLSTTQMGALSRHYLQAVAETNALLSEVTEGYQRTMVLQPIQDVAGQNLSDADRGLV